MEELERNTEFQVPDNDKQIDLLKLAEEPNILDIEIKAEVLNLPNTDNLLNIKVIKTSLLGKEQAKKRLQAFSQIKKLDVGKSKGSPSEYDKLEEKRKRKPKKSIDPSEKAKAVIEEIEELKKTENAYHAALEQEFLLHRQHDKKKRSKSVSREKRKRKSKYTHRRSRSREGNYKFQDDQIPKLTYPNNWKQLKENNFTMEMLPILFPAEYKNMENKIFDFRKQLLFQTPSYHLQQFLAEGVNGEPIIFPAEYIRFTKSAPAISYCTSKEVLHNMFNRKSVLEYVPRGYRNTIELFINNLTVQCKPNSPIRNTSRKWYPKENSACHLLESSLGLTFLQNYYDDDEQEKDEHNNEDVIDSDGVIADILEDISKTELLLSKNSLKEYVDNCNDVSNKTSELKEKVKKSKKKLNKISSRNKDHKAHKGNNQKKIKLENSFTRDKIIIKHKSKKEKSRDKSVDSIVPNTQSDLTNQHTKNNKKNMSKEGVDHTEGKRRKKKLEICSYRKNVPVDMHIYKKNRRQEDSDLTNSDDSHSFEDLHNTIKDKQCFLDETEFNSKLISKEKNRNTASNDENICLASSKNSKSSKTPSSVHKDKENLQKYINEIECYKGIKDEKIAKYKMDKIYHDEKVTVSTNLNMTNDVLFEDNLKCIKSEELGTDSIYTKEELRENDFIDGGEDSKEQTKHIEVNELNMEEYHNNTSSNLEKDIDNKISTFNKRLTSGSDISVSSVKSSFEPLYSHEISECMEPGVQENCEEMTDVVIEKERGTPNTDEYYSEWESELAENLIKPNDHNRSWESDDEHTKGDSISKKNNKSCVSSGRKDYLKGINNNCSLYSSPIFKESSSYKRQNSRDCSPEKFLEMPFNINNVRRNRHGWRDDPSNLRNLYSRSPDKIEMDFRLQNDKSFNLISEDSWEKSELLSIKTEELRLEQERLSLLQERHQLELEKQRFEEIEKEHRRFEIEKKHSAKKFIIEDKHRRFRDKKDQYHLHRDYDHFNLNNYIENNSVSSTESNRKNCWPLSNRDDENKLEGSTVKGNLNISSKIDLGRQKGRGSLKEEKERWMSERKSKSGQATIKHPKDSSKSPEKLENEYEKFLKLLESESVKKKGTTNVNLNDSEVTAKKHCIVSPKRKHNRSSPIQQTKYQRKKPTKSSSSSSNSSWSSSSSDSDSSTTSSSSTTSTSSSSSSNSSYKHAKKKQLLQAKIAIPSPTSTMKTKAIQVVKTEIEPLERDTTIATLNIKKSKINPSLLGVEAPLPVPSPKVVINPSTIECVLPISTENTFLTNMSATGAQTIIPSKEITKVFEEVENFSTNTSVVTTIKTEKHSSVSPEEQKDQSENIPIDKLQSKRSSISNNSTINEDEKLPKNIDKSVIAGEWHSNNEVLPKRKRDDSPVRSRGTPGDSPKRIKRHSPSPIPSDILKKKENLHRRKDYSPRPRDYSPKHKDYSSKHKDYSSKPKDYSPKRYILDRSPSKERKESIQETLLRLAGLDSASLRRKSPISSPVHGFKRSVADSTISDEQLLQYRVEEHLEVPKYYNRSSIPSPKRLPLDDRITQELGIPVHQSKTRNTTYSDSFHYDAHENQQYYDQYGNWDYNAIDNRNNYKCGYSRTVNQNVLQSLPFVENKPTPKQKPPLQQNEVTNTSQKIKQVGNILEIIPTESIETPEMPQSSTFSPIVKDLSSETNLGNVAHSTPKVSTTTKLITTSTTVTSSFANISDTNLQPITPKARPAVSKLAIEFSPASSTTLLTSPSKDMNAEALIKRKMQRRAEKDRRKLERDQKRDVKEKNRVSRMIMLNELNSSTVSNETLLLEKENISLGRLDNIHKEKSKPPWPVPKIIFNSSHKPPEKGILQKHSRFNKSSIELNSTSGSQKAVKFLDGICPGEGTSPSGGEELSSPPPSCKKLPKEKRSKKTKMQKASKVLKKKKVKAKVVRRIEDEEDEDDDLPPPPPPPGSPPPHLFPARIKPVINNIHPTVAANIVTSILPPDTSVAPPPIFRPALNVLTHQRPPSMPPGPLQQHHLVSFPPPSIVTPAGTGLPQVPLNIPPPNYPQHHVGHQSPYITHHHH